MMNRYTFFLCGVLFPMLMSCLPKTADLGRSLPEPLSQRPFNLPEAQSGTLDNGLRVVVASNHETPTWQVQLVVNVGNYADPEGLEGLTSSTMDMMNEGAGDMNSEAISRELKRLAGSVSAWASTDSVSVSASGIKRNLEPILDLWATVLLEPTFPEEEWTIERNSRLQNLALNRQDPNRIAGRVFDKILWGDQYVGPMSTEASYEAITPGIMREFYEGHIAPDRGILLVGGDLTLDEMLPILNARLGQWKGAGNKVAPQATPATQDKPTIYLVDHPGAAQSVIYISQPIGTQLDEDYYDFYLGNLALGGAFTARINMNLREDKGYTYGARCRTDYNHGPGIWSCSTSVRSDATIPSLVELKREITEVLSSRLISDDEAAYFSSYAINGYPANYELTDSTLSEQLRAWIYNLPQDFADGFIPGLQSSSATKANEALQRHLNPDQMFWLIVGDKALFGEELGQFDMDIVELDVDGHLIEQSEVP